MNLRRNKDWNASVQLAQTRKHLKNFLIEIKLNIISSCFKNGRFITQCVNVSFDKVSVKKIIKPLFINIL